MGDVNGDGVDDLVGVVLTASQSQDYAVLFLKAGNLTFAPAQLTPIPDAIGQAMVPLPLPDNPALVNLTAYAQWGVADPLGVFSTPSGPFALTQGHTFVLR